MNKDENSINSGKWKKFFLRIKSSPGREFEQSILRLIIALHVFVYTVFISNDYLAFAWDTASGIILYMTAAIILFLWLVKSPVKTPLRYIFGSIIDILGLSYGMYLSGNLGIALYPLFLLVIFGYGFRFGRRYLALTTVESIVGFVVVYYISAYWQDHQILFNGLLLGLIILPLYVSILLKNLESKIEEAKVANKAKSQFLSNMSHELRTPLNGIISSNDLLKQSSLTAEQMNEIISSNDLLKLSSLIAEQNKYINTIEYSVTTLLGLIENILDLSKIEFGNKKVLHKSFDLHYLLNMTTQMLRPHADKKNLILKLEIDPQVPFLLIGDSNLTQQVLVNLVGNAIKYTDAGSIIVRVSLNKINNGNCKICFEIIDTGIGIKKDYLNTIFDRFSQVDNSDTRIFEGAGLGTTIAKEVTLLLNGKIGVDSEFGEGSTFWFEIPYEIEKMDYENNNVLSDMRTIFIHNDNQNGLHETLTGWGVTLLDINFEDDLINTVNKTAEENKKNHAIICCCDKNIDLFAQELESNSYLKGVPLIFINTNANSDEENSKKVTNYGFKFPSALNTRQLFNALHSSSLFLDEINHSKKTEIEKHISNGKNYTILLAEDDCISQELLSVMLTNDGHKVTIANNGQEALDKLEVNSYDLCIIDMQMPVMGGLQAIKTYKNINPKSKMPFVILTANATVEEVEKGKDAGAEMFLIKPIRSVDLLKAIASINI